MAIAVTAFAVPAQAASSSSEGGLGTKDPAKGTPVKIGIITNGKSRPSTRRIETPVAEATAKWINEYHDGIGGHPIELDHLRRPRRAEQGHRLREPDDPGQGRRRRDRPEQLSSERSGRRSARRGIPLYPLRRVATRTSSPTPRLDVRPRQRPRHACSEPASEWRRRTRRRRSSAVAIDVPAATQLLQGPRVRAVPEGRASKLELIPVAAGTADMTPQMQRVVTTTRRAWCSSSATTRSASPRSTGCAPPASRAGHHDPAVPHRRHPHRGAGRLPEGHPDLGHRARSRTRRTRRSSSTTPCSKSTGHRDVDKSRPSAASRCSPRSAASTSPTQDLEG